MKTYQIKVHEIATDGLPKIDETDPDDPLIGCVAFIFDGNIVSGHPIPGGDLWQADTDVGRHEPFSGVTHWVEFPEPLWDIGVPS